MAFVKGQPKTPGSGRRKKKRNEMTADIKAAFRLHGDECVSAIMKLTKSKDERVRLGALQTALDRGFGNPTPQALIREIEPVFRFLHVRRPIAMERNRRHVPARCRYSPAWTSESTKIPPEFHTVLLRHRYLSKP